MAHEELLEEFETLAKSSDSLNSFLQQVSQRLHEELTRYNWVGFYFMEAPANDTLVLGPYVGSFVPLARIPIEKGLCGTAARTKQTVCVNDVPNDPRYIGGDMVKANIVVPILIKNRAAAEICIESYFAGSFDATEQRFIESCATLVGRFMEKDGAKAKNAGAHA